MEGVVSAISSNFIVLLTFGVSSPAVAAAVGKKFQIACLEIFFRLWVYGMICLVLNAVVLCQIFALVLVWPDPVLYYPAWSYLVRSRPHAACRGDPVAGAHRALQAEGSWQCE